MLHIGRVPATADDHDQALQQVAADLVTANFDVPLPEDVMPWKYRKLISNIGNVFQALVGRNGPAGHRCRGGGSPGARCGRHSIHQRAEEAAARAAGFVKPVAGVSEFVGGSTWQSLQRGTGNIETDYLNGEIVMIAHRLGIEAPINKRLAIWLDVRLRLEPSWRLERGAARGTVVRLIDQSLDVVGKRCLNEARSAESSPTRPGRLRPARAGPHTEYTR